MFEFVLPIWIVRRRKDNAPHPKKPNGSRAHRIAFESAEFTARFTHARKNEPWEVHCVANDQDLLFLVKDLHNEGLLGLRFNPDLDGKCGTEYSLRDLLLQIENRRGPGPLPI